MNYFPFHIGDYAAHTGHLEPMEDLAYRRLLEQYYLREGPLPADVEATAKLVRMRSMKSDVESVLKEFFVLGEDGWRHARCDEEVARMQDKQAKARGAAEQSVKSRRASAERRLSLDQTSAERALASIPTDVELPTPTPTPTPTPSSVPNGTAVDDGNSQSDLTRAELWSAGKSLLLEQGMPKAQCGSFVGKLVKDYGDETVVEAVRSAVVARPADAAQYLKATCQHSAGQRSKGAKHSNFENQNYHESL